MSKWRPTLLDSTPLSGTDEDRIARSLAVHANGDIVLIGWAIRSDTVLVEAYGLNMEVRVVVDGHDVSPIGVHESASTESAGRESFWGADSTLPLTALELPPGTLTVNGERSVPGFGPAALPSDVMPAHVSFWCRFFPRMRGC